MTASSIAAIRTVVQYAVSFGIAWLASLGFELPPDLAEVIFAGFFGLVVFAVNELGGRYDWVNRLFSLGLSPSAATYAKP
jgi:hypothetical protein